MTDDPITRQCVCCGKELTIQLGPNGEILDEFGYWPNLNEEFEEYWECRECMETD